MCVYVCVCKISQAIHPQLFCLYLLTCAWVIGCISARCGWMHLLTRYACVIYNVWLKVHTHTCHPHFFIQSRACLYICNACWKTNHEYTQKGWLLAFVLRYMVLHTCSMTQQMMPSKWYQACMYVHITGHAMNQVWVRAHFHLAVLKTWRLFTACRQRKMERERERVVMRCAPMHSCVSSTLYVPNWRTHALAHVLGNLECAW